MVFPRRPRVEKPVYCTWKSGDQIALLCNTFDLRSLRTNPLAMPWSFRTSELGAAIARSFETCPRPLVLKGRFSPGKSKHTLATGRKPGQFSQTIQTLKNKNQCKTTKTSSDNFIKTQTKLCKAYKRQVDPL